MTSSGVEPTSIVGRAREQAAMSDQLAHALAGRGSLLLVSGEAGIGKTALVRAFIAEAAMQGCLVLNGACYDAGMAPPYGPWCELAASAARRDERLLSPPVLELAPTPDAFVAELRGFLQALAERGPVVLVLEDLHWADPESLEFLRLFTRQLAEMSVLVVATYRDHERTTTPALDRVLPHLVRESNAQRLLLQPLDEPAIQTLVERRYELPGTDLTRLSAHLQGRSQGVPLYLLELLRSLEEEQRLRRTQDGWELGEIDGSHVPALVRQVIDGRLERLGPDVRRLLGLAAVIGQELPLLFWRRVSGVADEVFDEAVERALEAHVLEDASSGMQLRFTHSLIRDTLYEGRSLPRRQHWHRRVAEALTTEADAEPETIAHHFRQALDPRAVDWFIRAGSRAERVAWSTAASHFEAALAIMGTGDATSSERGWLMLRRARMLRVSDQRTALALLDTAATLAEDAADAVLRAYVKFLRGQVGMVAGGGRAALANLEARVVEFAQFSPADVARVEEIERQAVFPSRIEMDGHMGAILAAMGRIDEALTHTQATIERIDGIPDRAWWGRGIALAHAGRVAEAREAYTIARNACQRASDVSSVVMIYLYQISTVELPYGSDNLAERSRIAREAEAAWRRVGGALGDAAPRTAWLPFLQIEGEWESARALALSGIRPSDASSERDLMSATVLAQLARAQGDVALAWELVYALLPSGPHAVPGYTDFGHTLPRMRIAAGLSLDHNDLAAAQAWLDAHDRWLAWSGAVLGRADGECSWAEYCLAAGDIGAARQHASQGLALASEPRQPLALLAAHRLLGMVETHAGRLVDARQHLDAAHALADACSAPYERALTLLAGADLALRAGVNDEAGTALDEARAICTPLAAKPTLVRIDALVARLGNQTSAMQRTAPAGLSPREIEVLRLLAVGKTNREIAETLFLSARTVERHITNLYLKIGVQNRAEAIAFAHDHDLT